MENLSKDLSKDLDILRELNELRDRAKELRHQGLQPLKRIIDIRPDETPNKRIHKKPEDKDFPVKLQFEQWASSGNTVEIALLAKLQNHRDICSSEDENNMAQAHRNFKNRLTHIKLNEDLMPLEREEPPNIDEMKSVPVVAAARTMQVLAGRSETALSRSSMICYYRILREIYGAAPPDWTVGAARAGFNGTTSAFVTGECIRAIFTFRNTIQRTATFCHETIKLLEGYQSLRSMLYRLDNKPNENHPLQSWADKTMEARWLDWFLSTNLRLGQIALFYNDEGEKSQKGIDFENFNEVSDNLPNQLFSCPGKQSEDDTKITVEKVGKYFKTLAEYLQKSLIKAKLNITKAQDEINEYRKSEERLLKEEEDKNTNHNKIKDLNERLQRSASAHLFAKLRIYDSIRQIDRLLIDNGDSLMRADEAKLSKTEPEEIEKIDNKYLTDILERLSKVCENNVYHLNEITAPTEQYIKGVLRRELSNPPSLFDAGELVFAAMSFGAMTDWKQHELLTRACEKLVEALPESGRLPTKRPLHTSTRGYRLLPIGCEMTRGLAQLFDSMKFEFTAQFVGRILNVFEEKLQYLRESENKNMFVGWNFDGAPNPNTPCVWVSAVSVLALDRVVRMLDTRINNTIIKHFEVIKPEKPHTDLPINELIFADYGFNEYYFKQYPKIYEQTQPIPIQLELMRAHLMRACLPRNYSLNANRKIFSTILYGPPGTGKTTLAEVLAFNSGKSLIQLSPSDLNLQGDGFIEGRAHDIFEALSMLTQTVIIFDEFEPMLKNRKPKEMTNRYEEVLRNKQQQAELDRQSLENFNKLVELYLASQETATVAPIDGQEELIKRMKEIAKADLDTSAESNELGNAALITIADELREIRKKDDPKVRFLLAGMLPKFLKLHDAAKTQSLVYFLGTNVFKDIDLAAQRSGRFDSKIPIYNPCPLSRAGTFLYLLSKNKDTAEKVNLSNDKEQLKRFFEVIVATVNEPASELAQKYFNMKNSDNLKYVIGEADTFTPNFEGDKIEQMKKRFAEDKENLEDIEIKEYDWLIAFEENFKERKEELQSDTSNNYLEFLAESLVWKPEEAVI